MPTVKIQTIFLGWALTSYSEFFAGIFTKCSKPKQLMDTKGWAETEGRNSAEGSVGLLSNSGEVPQGMLPSTHRSNKPRTSETSTKAEPWVETWPQESAITEITWCLCQRQRNRRLCPLRSWVKELQVEVSRTCSFHEVFLSGGISTLPQESETLQRWIPKPCFAPKEGKPEVMPDHETDGGNYQLSKSVNQSQPCYPEKGNFDFTPYTAD